MPRIQALLIGVGNYSSDDITNLVGPPLDVKLVAKAIKNLYGEAYEISYKKLVSEKATKVAIFKAMKKHFWKPEVLGEEDILLFFFSGHGSQEHAAEVFHPYTDNGKLENLVCHDFNGEAGIGLIANKELRYLFHQFGKQGCRIVSIFDCCHSGGIVRGDAAIKKISAITEKRLWEDFIFSDAEKNKSLLPSDWVLFKEAQFVKSSLEELIPQSNFVQLAACKSSESAYDLKGGIFINSVVDELIRTNGKISYHDLLFKTKQKIAAHYQQTPTGAFYPISFDNRFHAFLSHKNVVSEAEKGIVSYHYRNRQLEVNLGSIHGLLADKNGNYPSLSLFQAGKYLGEAKVSDVKLDSAKVHFPDDIAVNFKIKYQATFNNNSSSKLAISLSGPQVEVKRIKEMTKEDPFFKEKGIQIGVSKKQANYQIHCSQETLIFRFPDQDFDLIYPIKNHTQNTLIELKSKLNHLSRWNYVKSLHNPNSDFSPNDIQLQINQKGKIVEPVSEGQFYIESHYTQLSPEDETPHGYFKMQVKNTSKKPYKVSLLFLGTLFSSQSIVHGDWIELHPNQVYKIMDGGDIPYKLDDYLRYRKEEKVYFLVIQSTQEFNLENFKLPSLKEPKKSTTRGKPAIPNEWQAFLYTLHIPISEENQIS